MRNYEVLALLAILWLIFRMAKLERSMAAMQKDLKKRDCEVTVPDDCNTLLLMINSHDVNLKTAAFNKLNTLLPELVVNQAGSISSETVARMTAALLHAIADGCNFTGKVANATSVYNAICYYLSKTENDEDRQLVAEFRDVLQLAREPRNSLFTPEKRKALNEPLIGKRIVSFNYGDPQLAVAIDSVYAETPATYTNTFDPDELLQIHKENLADLIIVGPFTSDTQNDAKVLIQKIARVNSHVPIILMLKMGFNDDLGVLGTVRNVVCYLHLPINPFELLSITSRIFKNQFTSSGPRT